MLPVTQRRNAVFTAATDMTAASGKRRARTAALIPAALLVLALVAGGSAGAEPLPQTLRFQFELWAQNHCPDDIVVWINARSQIYNSSDERWYGRTADGAFVCKLDAEKAGYRAKTPL
jgi:hypothetical protein